MGISLENRELRGMYHFYNNVVNIAAPVNDEGVVVYRICLAGGSIIEYPADEWILTLNGAKGRCL